MERRFWVWIVAALLIAPIPGAAWAATTERVSADSAGAQGNGNSSQASVSADGRFVAFASLATNLVAGNTHSGIRDCRSVRRCGPRQDVGILRNQM